MAEIAEFCGETSVVNVGQIRQNHEILVQSGDSSNHYVAVNLEITNGDGQLVYVTLKAHRDDDDLSPIFPGTGLKSYRLTLEEV